MPTALAALFLAVSAASRAAAPAAPELQRLQAVEARFAPVDVDVDLSALKPQDRRALAKLVEAARVMDPLFLRQDWEGSGTMLAALAQDDSELGGLAWPSS